MATHEIPVDRMVPDSSGDAYEEPAEVAMTLGTAVLDTLPVLTIEAPTGSDIGVYGTFTVPQNYAGTPVLVIRGYIAEAANTLAFGCQQLGRDHSESVDTALEAEDLASNATWTGLAAEELYEETITLTPGSAYAAGDVVNFFLFRDNSVDTQTGDFHIAGVYFQYSDT